MSVYRPITAGGNARSTRFSLRLPFRLLCYTLLVAAAGAIVYFLWRFNFHAFQDLGLSATGTAWMLGIGMAMSAVVSLRIGLRIALHDNADSVIDPLSHQDTR